jgi:hypothetical protein
MGQGAQQIEPWFDRVKPGGEKRTDEYRRANKKHKILKERRKGKQFEVETSTEFDGEKYEDHSEIVPKHATNYRKYDGWEY